MAGTDKPAGGRKRGKGQAAKPKQSAIARIDVTIRRQQCVEMKKAGMSLRAIAQRLSISHEQVRQDIADALNELHESMLSKTEQFRALQVARLDELLSVHWVPALKGDPEAADRVVRIIAEQSRIGGAYQPITQTNVYLGRPQIREVVVERPSSIPAILDVPAADARPEAEPPAAGAAPEPLAH